jgi:hypothetical protein
MNKNYRLERRRAFILEGLPPMLSRSSDHLQYFDNYLSGTRLRLRTTREPKSKEWAWSLEQRYPAAEEDLSRWNVGEITLSEAEHDVLSVFEGREVGKNQRAETPEVRFNRYEYEHSGTKYFVDVFLNPLWGLNLAKVFFESDAEMNEFRVPQFAFGEVTQNPFFAGKNLAGKSFADVQAEIGNVNNYELGSDVTQRAFELWI